MRFKLDENLPYCAADTFVEAGHDAKEMPADFDACWDPTDVDLDRLDPVLLDLSDGRNAQKRRFGGEFLPNVVEASSGVTFSQFFQNDREIGHKGIVVLTLGGLA